MADSYIVIDEPAVTDKKLDTEQLTVGVNTVQRERMIIAGTGATDIAPVSATDGLLVNRGANNDVTVSGVATAANQSTANTALAAIQTAVELLDNVVKAEDAASAGGDQGLVVVAKRSDTPAATSGTDGDYEPLQVTGGRLAVQATGSGTFTVDGSGVTQPVSAASLPLPTGASTSANQTTIIGHLDGVEGLLTTIDADTGTLAGAVSGTEVQVDVVAALPAGTNNIGDVDVLSVVPGTGATSLGKAEDAAHTTGDVGVMALGVRQDSGASLAGTDGDYAPFQLDSSGNLRVNVAAGGAGDGAILDGVSSSIKATVLDYTNSNPLAVRLTDTSGDYVGAGAGTQYTEDAAAAADPTGTALIMVRDDALSGQTTADGDNVAARGTDKGELYVKHVDAIPVTDNGGALTVDGTVAVSGTVTVDGSGVTQPVSNAGLTALNGAISGTEVQVDVLTMPTTTVQATNLDIRDLAVAQDNVGVRPETSGGLSIFRSIDLDESEEEVKASAGQIYAVWFSNMATSTRFLKLYNATAANVTVGTTTPVVTLALPGNSSDDISGVFSSTMGIAFDTAICAAATTGIADNDTGAPGANEVIVNIFYK